VYCSVLSLCLFCLLALLLCLKVIFHHFSSSDLCSYVAPSDDRDCSQLEVKMWEPNKMSDYKVEQFLVVARSVI